MPKDLGTSQLMASSVPKPRAIPVPVAVHPKIDHFVSISCPKGPHEILAARSGRWRLDRWGTLIW